MRRVRNSQPGACEGDIISIPYYKGFVDCSRVELSRPPVNYPQPTAEEKEREAGGIRREESCEGRKRKGRQRRPWRTRTWSRTWSQCASDGRRRECRRGRRDVHGRTNESSACRTRTERSLRHSLDAAGEMKSAGREDDQWQCVRVQRAFAGMGEQPSIRCHREIETALGFDVNPDSSR
jgi:hypothetical protein